MINYAPELSLVAWHVILKPSWPLSYHEGHWNDLGSAQA